MLDRIQECLLKRPHKRSPADVKELAQHLSEFPCFMRGMHLAGIEALCRRMDFLQVPAMGVVLRQGDVGDSMFMVYKGTCQIYSCYGSTVSQAEAETHDWGAHISTKCQGGIVGEHSLISADSEHTYTATAGETGAEFLCIDRAAFWHIADQGRGGGSDIPAQVAAALRVACCQRILEMPPSDRSESEIRLLMEFLRGLQAFQDLSDPMMKKICKGITIEKYPANQVVCEEDEPGDSMFIVLSGQCIVRAQPPPDKSVDFVSHDVEIPPAAAPPGPPGTVKSVRRVKVSTTDKVLKPHSLAGHSRAFALHALVAEPLARNTTAVHDSAYWVQKFMHAAFNDQDPEVIGYGNDITPLAIVAAARWRKTLVDVQREEAIQKAETERIAAEQEKELKSRTEGMAGLIGKSAAMRWKKATFGEAEGEKKPAVDWRQESMRIREQRLQEQEQQDAEDAEQEQELSRDVAVAQPEYEADDGPEVLQRRSTDISLRLYNPNKQKLAQLGKLAPSNVSHNLRRELAQRARLDSILRSMEKMIQRQGPARRLGKSDSRKITRALNRSMLKGASRQVGRMRVPRLSKAASQRNKQAQSEMGTETNTHVGADTDDWKSSLDCSDRESLITDDRSMMHTDRSQVSTGGESLENDEGAWRHVQWGGNAVPGNARQRASTQSMIAMPSMAALEYGPIIRTLSPGEAFGELALLQPHCLRTATVIATPSTKQDESTSGSQDGISLLNTAILSAEEQSPHAAGVPDAAGERVSLIKLTRQLFDESVTSMQVTQLESRLSFLMKFNVFQSLQRDRLTALAVFFRQEHVPAGRVLANQGAEADRVFLIQEGEVAYVLEGANAGNPMKPKPSLSTTIPGLPYLSLGSLSGMRMAMEKCSTRDVQNRDSRFVMHQLSDKIRAQEQAEAEQEGKDTEEQEAEQLAKETVVKHWGAKQRKAKAKIAALVGDEADAAAEQYEQRHIDGLKLLVVGSGEMVGELSLGVKEPELHEPEDPADAARKLVDAAKQRRLGHQNSRKRLERSESSSMNPQLKKVDYVDTEQEVKSAGYPATLVTTKTCSLLSIATTDLLRFGSGVKEAVQTAAWSQRAALLDMLDRVTETNEEMNISVSSARSMPEASRWAAQKAASPAPRVFLQQQTAPTHDSRPSWAILPGERGVEQSPNFFGDFLPQAGQLRGETVERISNGATASWMPTAGGSSFGLAGAHIQRTLSGQRTHAGGG